MITVTVIRAFCVFVFCALLPCLASAQQADCLAINTNMSSHKLLPYVALETGQSVSAQEPWLDSSLIFTAQNKHIQALDFDNGKKAYWLRFCVQYLLSTQEAMQPQKPMLDLILDLEPARLQTVEFHAQGTTFKTGSSRLFNTRQINDRDYAFNLTLVPGIKQYIYIKVSSLRSVKVGATLWSKHNYWSNKSLRDIKFGLFSGILLGLTFYILLLFSLNRQKSLLLYCGFSLSAYWQLIFFYGLAGQYLVPNSPSVAYLLYQLSFIPLFLFSTLFTRSYITLKHSSFGVQNNGAFSDWTSFCLMFKLGN